MKFIFKPNPITGELNLVPKIPNKLIYTNETITVATNTFLILVSPKLDGTTVLEVDGTGILEVI